MFHARFLWNFWDASKSSVRAAKLGNLMRLKADLSMWGADFDLQLQPKQAKNIKKATISQRSSNKSNLKDSKICKLHVVATSEIQPCHERMLLMSRTLALSMRHVSGAPNLPDLKGSQPHSYKLCTNFANIFGILHDLAVLIVRPPYILCTCFLSFFLHGSKTKESSSSQDSKLWTRTLAAPNKWVQVINRDGRWESGQVNKKKSWQK